MLSFYYVVSSLRDDEIPYFETGSNGYVSPVIEAHSLDDSTVGTTVCADFIYQRLILQTNHRILRNNYNILDFNRYDHRTLNAGIEDAVRVRECGFACDGTGGSVNRSGNARNTPSWPGPVFS